MTTGRTDMRFNDPRLTNLNFQINKDFIGEFEDEIEIIISMYIQRESTKQEGVSTYTSTLKLNIGEESEYLPFYCEIEMTGTFFLSNHSDVEEESFTNYNTAAILYSYARPIVSDIVAKSGFPPYNLPFMDFSKEDLNIRTN